MPLDVILKGHNDLETTPDRIPCPSLRKLRMLCHIEMLTPFAVQRCGMGLWNHFSLGAKTIHIPILVRNVGHSEAEANKHLVPSEMKVLQLAHLLYLLPVFCRTLPGHDDILGNNGLKCC